MSVLCAAELLGGRCVVSRGLSVPVQTDGTLLLGLACLTNADALCVYRHVPLAQPSMLRPWSLLLHCTVALESQFADSFPLNAPYLLVNTGILSVL